MLHILTIIDHSDFGKELFEGAFSTQGRAVAYYEETGLSDAKLKVDPEYHRSIDCRIRAVKILG